MEEGPAAGMRRVSGVQLAEALLPADYDGLAESEPVYAAGSADEAMFDETVGDVFAFLAASEDADSTVAADSANDPLAPTIQWEWRYQYDAFGNLKEHRRDFPDSTHQTRTFAIDVHKNRLSSATYAATGDLVSWAGGSYTYDESGDLQQVGADIVHLYTAGGERIGILQMEAAGYIERYRLRSPGGQVLREWLRSPSEPAGRLTWNRDYVWRGGALLAQENLSGESWHFSLDHLGSPRLVTRNGGVVLAQYELAPFGEEMSDTSGMPIGAEFFSFRFTGHERDHGAGGTLDDLDYMHARHYTPHAGRFLQIDPVLGRAGSPQSWNRYAYVRNDPINQVDPTGRVREEPFNQDMSDGCSYGSFASTCNVGARDPGWEELEAWDHYCETFPWDPYCGGTDPPGWEPPSRPPREDPGDPEEPGDSCGVGTARLMSADAPGCINESTIPVVVKPENDEDPICFLPGKSTYSGRIDGIMFLGANTSWLKVTDYSQVRIGSNGDLSITNRTWRAAIPIVPDWGARIGIFDSLPGFKEYSRFADKFSNWKLPTGFAECQMK